MRRLLASFLALALALPAPAAALSCMRPDVRRAYQSAAKSPDTYLIVQGSVDFNSARLPKSARSAGKQTLIPARLTGRAVTPGGYSGWLDRKITLRVTCVSEWCGSLPANSEMLMFLRQSAAGYTLDVSPCPTRFFPNPPASLIKQLRSCMSGGTCKPRRG